MTKPRLASRIFAGLFATLAATAAFATDTLRHQQESGRFGVAAPAAMAGRTVAVGADSRSLMVTHREIVTIVNGGKQFTWQFFTLNTASFDLASIAPKDFGTGHVRIYVNSDPADSQSGAD